MICERDGKGGGRALVPLILSRGYPPSQAPAASSSTFPADHREMAEWYLRQGSKIHCSQMQLWNL